MTEDIETRIMALPVARRVRFYLSYAHQVTILARGFYDESAPERIQECNEVVHRVLGHLIKVQAGTSNEALEASFAKMIVGGAISRGWQELLTRAFTLID